MLEEQRIVNEAKLEDLLRRGTAADLKAANELMQVMSGYVRECCWRVRIFKYNG